MASAELRFNIHPERGTMLANSGSGYLLDRQYKRAVLRAGADLLVKAGIPPILRNLTASLREKHLDIKMPAEPDLFEDEIYRDGSGDTYHHWADGRVAMSVGWDYRPETEEGRNRDYAYKGFVVAAEPITRQLIVRGGSNYEVIPVERWLFDLNGRKILEAATKEAAENPNRYSDPIIL